MNPELSSLEEQLKDLRAASLDDALLDRMEACAAGAWTALSPTEIAFGKQLAATAPAKLPEALQERLETLLAAVPFQVDEKIVSFPAPAAVVARSRSQGSRGWAAAAAVALFGACAALLVPEPSSSPKVAERATPAPVAPQAVSADVTDLSLVPAGFNRGLSAAMDEGVIWRPDDRPHRVFKVVYREQVHFKDKQGRTYQMEQPRTEYIIIPARND